MSAHRNHRLPLLTPAQFRRRVRPYLPGTVLELRRLWPRAKRQGYERGQRFLVGPYCSGCGAGFVWLFRADGTLDCTAPRRWLRENFQVIAEGRGRSLYTFPKPWPPRVPRLQGAA